MTTQRTIKGLAEIALQVQDIEIMTGFYEQIVNLELLRRFDAATFFRIADGVDGHTQVLALFDRTGNPDYSPVNPGARPAPLDHLAFGISSEDFDLEHQRLLDLGCDVSVAVHSWVGWRSMYVEDPEGNQVEWVCYEASLLDSNA